VKIRGYRIEPGEIEATLVSHPAVREAVVVAREDSPGDKRLIAYVVPNDTPGPAPSDLRTHLKSVLPEYMLPAAILMLDALPLTLNGKVDRQSLPAVSSWRRSPEPAQARPVTPIQDRIRSIWRTILDARDVRLDDDFFSLGGHSLLAARIIWDVSAAFGVNLPLQTLFDAPILADFATAVERELAFANSNESAPHC
jgi:acyl carrier protein